MGVGSDMRNWCGVPNGKMNGVVVSDWRMRVLFFRPDIDVCVGAIASMFRWFCKLMPSTVERMGQLCSLFQ